MQEYQTYQYIFQNLPRKFEVKKIIGQNILKCAIIEVKDYGITKVNMRNYIFVTYMHVAYVPCEVVANCFRESF